MERSGLDSVFQNIIRPCSEMTWDLGQSEVLFYCMYEDGNVNGNGNVHLNACHVFPAKYLVLSYQGRFLDSHHYSMPVISAEQLSGLIPLWRRLPWKTRIAT